LSGAREKVDAHRPEDDPGARLDVNDVETETLTLSRTFGMVPASRDDVIAPAVLDRVMHAANAFIKAGAELDPAVLEGTTMVAVKRFYTAARQVPWLDPVLQSTRLRERAWRCASNVAYFALQEHRRRCTILPAMVQAMQGMLFSSSLARIRLGTFPERGMLDVARDFLKDANLPGGCLSSEYLSGMARHARRLLKAALGTRFKNEVTRSISALAKDATTIVEAVSAELQGCLGGLPVSLTRATSKQLTHRVKDRVRGRGPPSGRHRFDALVDGILDGKTLACWQQARRPARDALLQELESLVGGVYVVDIASVAARDLLSTMTVDEALVAMFSVRSSPPAKISGIGSIDMARVLREWALASARNCIGEALWVSLAPVADRALGEMAEKPERHVLLPRITKQVVPLAIDDGQVYRLDLEKEEGTGRVASATVRFSLEPGATRTFRLRGLDRIDAMLARGFVPARGTITRKPGGRLLLHLPFEKECPVEPFSGADDGEEDCLPSSKVVAGTDLGLKHLAWASIAECQRSVSGDGSWEPVDGARQEIARVCIDQAQLGGPKDAWLAGLPLAPAPNLKRELVTLALQARALQQKKDRLRRRYRGFYRHVWQCFVTRREWQRCWRKMRHVHEEMARQVATRLVAACRHHGVQVLRFEDLSWSRHSAKRVSGAWLSSWQVHWFFSQVQARATLLARLAGIAVELVDARGTSKRCSACNTTGIRAGKTFSCTNDGCKKVMDSDLNAARNVRIAPISPRPRAKGEGARYRPLACQV
jgi:transposase